MVQGIALGVNVVARYFVLENDKANGPLTEVEVVERVQDFMGVDPEVKICREGQRDWYPLSTYPEFAHLLAPPPVPVIGGDAAASAEPQQEAKARSNGATKLLKGSECSMQGPRRRSAKG
jgi:hypothetical protein